MVFFLPFGKKSCVLGARNLDIFPQQSFLEVRMRAAVQFGGALYALVFLNLLSLWFRELWKFVHFVFFCVPFLMNTSEVRWVLTPQSYLGTAVVGRRGVENGPAGGGDFNFSCRGTFFMISTCSMGGQNLVTKGRWSIKKILEARGGWVSMKCPAWGGIRTLPFRRWGSGTLPPPMPTYALSGNRSLPRSFSFWCSIQCPIDFPANA